MANNPEGKRMIPIYIDEAIYRLVKVYAAETDQSFQQVIKVESESFEQSLLKLADTLREMRRQAEEKRQRQEEEQRIVAEHPLQVPGHEVNPIENEPTITA